MATSHLPTCCARIPSEAKRIVDFQTTKRTSSRKCVGVWDVAGESGSWRRRVRTPYFLGTYAVAIERPVIALLPLRLGQWHAHTQRTKTPITSKYLLLMPLVVVPPPIEPRNLGAFVLPFHVFLLRIILQFASTKAAALFCILGRFHLKFLRYRLRFASWHQCCTSREFYGVRSSRGN